MYSLLFGISPSANICSSCRLQASLTRSATANANRFPLPPRLAEPCLFMVAPPTQKGHPLVSFALSRVDKKDAKRLFQNFFKKIDFSLCNIGIIRFLFFLSQNISTFKILQTFKHCFSVKLDIILQIFG